MPDTPRCLGFIPARGGSKRLPRKNIVDFFGKPVIAYSIEAALDSECIERVVVSTEDTEIREIAVAFGAEVVDRAPALAVDDVGVVDVCMDYLSRHKDKYERLCCLYPAAPLRTAKDVRAVISLLEPGACDFAMAVTSYDLPPHQAMLDDGDGSIRPLFPDLFRLNEDAIGRLVVDNGSTYAVDVDAFAHARTFVGPSLRGHWMPRERSVDINAPVDLDLARYFFQRRVP